MIIDLNKVAAFTCPCCVEVTRKNISLFDISKNSQTNLKCSADDCTSNPVTISHKGSSYALSIQCPACLEKHTFRFTAAKLVKSPLLIFRCTNTMESIAALGNEDCIEEILEDLEDFEASDSYNDFVGGNFDILYKMVDKLNDLNEQSQIKCHCNGDEIALDIRENQIVLTCIHCGKSLYINIDENSFMQLSLINSLLIT